MKFLVDAQLPRRLSHALNDAGHDAIHTLDLPDQNRTGDSVISAIADEDERVVITKDSDFRDSHLMRGTPRRLLRVVTGNLGNAQLMGLFDRNLASIVEAFGDADFIELSLGEMVVHPRGGHN